MVPLISVFPWGTKHSSPPTVRVPCVGSISPSNKRNSVVLPIPVSPMMAVLLPGLKSWVKCSMTLQSPSAYRKLTSATRMLPRSPVSLYIGVLARSFPCASAPFSSSNRSMLAVAWMTPGTMFSSCRMGCCIMPTNCRNEVITPNVMVPLRSPMPPHTKAMR